MGSRAEGRELELDVTKIAHGGVGVARHEGRVVFVVDAIPGERVVARVEDDSKERFWRAAVLRVLEPSPDRVPHVWPEADLFHDPAERPGGADYGHIALPRQRALKGEVLAEALARFAGIEARPAVEALPGEADGSGWRTRERLHIASDGSVGPYAARSHRVVRVSSLPLAVPELRGLAPASAEPRRGGILLVAPSADAPRVAGAGGTIRERVGERELLIEEGGFWQVHRHAAETLAAAVRQALDPALLDPGAANLDLYGGVGLLAAALGDAAGPGLRITTVESDPRASAHAAANLAEWRAEAVAARVERWVRGLADLAAAERSRLRAATVVLDPPRSGAGRAVLEALAAAGPAQLVYVACDPVALARDAGALAGLGYELTGLRAYDLFPHTHHVEAVAAFRRV